MFKKLYSYRGTLYIVTRHPETIPLTRFMVSNGLDLEVLRENEPTSDTISIITPEEAEGLFGNTASLLDGVSVGLSFHFKAFLTLVSSLCRQIRLSS
jgi:hypothetical protein